MFYSAYDPIVEKDQLSYLGLNDAGRVHMWAHGELQTLLGHDQIVTSSISSYNNIWQATRHAPTKFLAFAMDKEARAHQVCVYAWRPEEFEPRVRGLVVLIHDAEAQEFAQMHMDKRSAYI